jgi:molybdenum cofactor biosynthesis protein B
VLVFSAIYAKVALSGSEGSQSDAHMSTPARHKSVAPHSVACAAITVSDTRTPRDDRGGQLLCDLLSEAGNVVVVRQIIRDEPAPMRSLLLELRGRGDVDAVLMTGGTGISPRDQTYETVRGLLDKELPGYGELLRRLSHVQVGPAAILSRATGGLMGQTVLLTMPGSPAAVELAMRQIILPELGHLVREARKVI